jgi:hypothetical protein
MGLGVRFPPRAPLLSWRNALMGNCLGSFLQAAWHEIAHLLHTFPRCRSDSLSNLLSMPAARRGCKRRLRSEALNGAIEK